MLAGERNTVVRPNLIRERVGPELLDQVIAYLYRLAIRHGDAEQRPAVALRAQLELARKRPVENVTNHGYAFPRGAPSERKCTACAEQTRPLIPPARPTCGRPSSTTQPLGSASTSAGSASVSSASPWSPESPADPSPSRGASGCVSAGSVSVSSDWTAAAVAFFVAAMSDPSDWLTIPACRHAGPAPSRTARHRANQPESLGEGRCLVVRSAKRGRITV